MTGPDWLWADWPAPPGVCAGVTSRQSSPSGTAAVQPPEEPLGDFNLALHVGDDPPAVLARRARLRDALDLPAEPLWLRQVHGVGVVRHRGDAMPSGPPPEGDASVSSRAGTVLAVLTADCLPVVLASRDGQAIGIAHAGWRGLAGGVLEATVAALGIPPQALVAWLGPSIEPPAFEVGGEVRDAFVTADPTAAADFLPNARGRFLANLVGLARRRLAALGVGAVHGGGRGTFADAGRWYSHRRDARSGRMATLVWRLP